MTIWEQRRWLNDFRVLLGEDSIKNILIELTKLSKEGAIYYRRTYSYYILKNSSVSEQVAALMASTGAQSYTAARFMVQRYQDSLG